MAHKKGRHYSSLSRTCSHIPYVKPHFKNKTFTQICNIEVYLFTFVHSSSGAMPHLHNVLLKSGYHLLGSPFLFKNICFDFQRVTNYLAIILKIFYKTLDTYLYFTLNLYSQNNNKTTL